MSFDRLPSKVEVMGWSQHHLADYMKKMNLSGCDKVIINNCINGSRFLNMSENDLQKFPKVHAPLISKICLEISRKEEKRGLFGKKSTIPKYREPETPVEDQCWGPDEFDGSDDDDYESPDSCDGDSVGDYESPTEECSGCIEEPDNDNDYEPPPSESDESTKMIAPQLPIGESDYIDNRRSSQGQPPALQPRPGHGPTPPAAPRTTLTEPTPPRQELSPLRQGRLPTRGPLGCAAPQVDRSKKPSAVDRRMNSSSPLQARRPSAVDRPLIQPQSWRSPAEERGLPDPPRVAKPPLPAASVNRSSSSVGRGLNRAPVEERGALEPPRVAKPPLPATSINRSSSSAGRGLIPNRFALNSRTEVQDEAIPTFNSHTFPLKSRAMGSMPGPPGPPHTDSLPPILNLTGSLPHKLQEAISSHRNSTRISSGGQLVPLRPPVQPSYPPPADMGRSEDMDPIWYVSQVTRGKAESCLRQVNKDGAFLVRDSSKGSMEQPYTLMVLYQDKVFNIQIKRTHDQYLLGTGLKTSETFPSVSDIISHYQQTPLLLIDSKNRGSGQQNHCALMYPAGYQR
ncbi:lymphocyte cytosolic protein 2a [Osmerus eperlanus]|uniref:lymphocyte cytosolic protein 2a n=1 Tax=Osmerus eperlanus TaxID=29151 RepID=UPI002E0D2CE2